MVQKASEPSGMYQSPVNMRYDVYNLHQLVQISGCPKHVHFDIIYVVFRNSRV